MAATVHIREITQGVAASLDRNVTAEGATSTDKTSGTVRFKQALNATVDANNPIPIPAAGVNRSFEKVLTLAYMAAGGSVNINTPTFYTNAAASPWTGVSLYADNVDPGYPGFAPGNLAANYTVPVMTDSAIATTDAFTYTAGVPLALSGGGEAGPFTWANYGDDHVGHLLYLQMDVGPTASAGTLASTTLTFSYNEV